MRFFRWISRFPSDRSDILIEASLSSSHKKVYCFMVKTNRALKWKKFNVQRKYAFCCTRWQNMCNIQAQPIANTSTTTKIQYHRMMGVIKLNDHSIFWFTFNKLFEWHSVTIHCIYNCRVNLLNSANAFTLFVPLHTLIAVAKCTSQMTHSTRGFMLLGKVVIAIQAILQKLQGPMWITAVNFPPDKCTDLFEHRVMRDTYFKQKHPLAKVVCTYHVKHISAIMQNEHYPC